MAVENLGVDAALAAEDRGRNYKWIALSNTTLGILMVTINQSILLISLPALFRGINLNPLVSSNTSYFLWVFMGFMLVTAVLVVSLGRVGDIFGRVRMYNLGELDRDPDRRLPGERAGQGDGDQRHRCRRRFVPRPDARRRARPHRMAPGLPGVGSVRPVRHGLGLPQAA